MIIRRQSFLLTALERLSNPTQYLPPIFMYWTSAVRVGTDTTSFVRLTFRRPR